MGKKLIIKKGTVFGRLAIVKEVKKQRNERRFLCKCSCGNQKEISLVQLTTSKTKSCGCYRKEFNSKKYKTHCASKTRLYGRWCLMRGRCSNPKNNRYHYYGGRGISVCDEWSKFETFKEWALKTGYDRNLTLERNDVNGNYEPENCRWATQADQTRNARSNINLTFNGRTECLSQMAQRHGICAGTLRSRLRRGASLEIALKAPISSGGRPLKC